MYNVRGRIRGLGIGVMLTAVLAFGAISVASAAAAAPEFRDLGKEPTTFSISGTSLSIETATSELSSCKALAGSGAITGPKSGSATIALSGCTTLPSYCHGKGLSATELKTVQLEVVPVYIKASQKVGLEFRPKAGSPFAELQSPFGSQCELAGSLIGQISPINSFRNEFTLRFEGLHGTQTPSQYENESHELVNSWLENENLSKFIKESWSGSATLKTSGRSIEIGG
jgi:hypothetical protein